MDQVFVVRHKVMVEGISVRRVARELGVSRNTVRRYLDGAPVATRVAAPRSRPISGVVRARIEELLGDAPRWTGGKQRLTAARLLRMLTDEGVTVGYTVVKDVVHEWRRRRQEVFVPLVYRPGELAQVDFFEVLVDLGGTRRKAHMFLMRLMHSGRDFAWLYPRQDQTCFLDGHVRAFAHFGALPQRLAYDNLRAAVAKMLVGSERELARRFLALSTHYVFEPCFARPRTGHDKGGVEARGKGIRLQELVPIPSGPDLGAISAALMARLDARVDTARFAVERAAMLPLPEVSFRAAAMRPATVTRRSLVSVAGALYSVWSTWAGLDVTAYVGVDEVELVGPGGARVVHPRQPFGGRSVDYRHYVRELARKPQALRQVADELIAALGEPYASAWRRLVDEHGPKQAARVFAQVLRALEDLGERDVATRVRAALASGEPLQLALRPAVVAAPAVPSDALPPSLVGIEVAAACAADFDVLLAGGAR